MRQLQTAICFRGPTRGTSAAYFSLCDLIFNQIRAQSESVLSEVARLRIGGSGLESPFLAQPPPPPLGHSELIPPFRPGGNPRIGFRSRVTRPAGAPDLDTRRKALAGPSRIALHGKSFSFSLSMELDF
jgi:hypothetical protein